MKQMSSLIATKTSHLLAEFVDCNFLFLQMEHGYVKNGSLLGEYLEVVFADVLVNRVHDELDDSHEDELHVGRFS